LHKRRNFYTLHESFSTKISDPKLGFVWVEKAFGGVWGFWVEEGELTGIGESNFASFIGIDPHSLATALEHGCSQSLLESQKCHNLYSLIMI